MPEKPLKVCLLGATFSTNNLGVGALTAGAIKVILHQSPEAEIVLLDYGRERLTHEFQCGPRKLAIPLLNMRFSKKLYVKNHIVALLLLALGLKFIPSRGLKNKIISRHFYLNHLAESDIVASLAGGDSFSDIYGLQRFFYVALPQVLALLMSRRLVLLPQTLGPFKGRLARAVAKFILKRACLVYSRDHAGLAETANFIGQAPHLKFCYDLGFVLDPIAPHRLEPGAGFENKRKGACLVGINVSGLLYMGGYTGKNMFGLKVDYQVLVQAVLEYFLSRPETLVLLVPHVMGSAEHRESDSAVCEKIYQEWKGRYPDRLFFAVGRYDQHEIKHVISRCDFFIGARMHACIAALSQAIPAVAIAYSKKFHGVLQTIGVEALVADPRQIGRDEILQLIAEAYERRAEIKRQLEREMPKVKKAVLNLFSDLMKESQGAGRRQESIRQNDSMAK